MQFHHLDENNYLRLYRFYEVDEGVYCVYCRNVRQFYSPGEWFTHEFYATRDGKGWKTEPEVRKELLADFAEAVKNCKL